MTILDTFNSDSFGVISLTTALDLIPYQPNWLGNLGIFQRKGITTTVAVIESREGRLSIVPRSARGTVTETENRPNRITRNFTVPHLALTDGILADDVQNIRAFGSESIVETLAQKVNDVAVSLRNDIEATKEFHRHKALEGVTTDPDGTVIFNFFTEFGTSQQTQDFVFTTATTDIKQVIIDGVIRNMHAALGGTMFSGIIGLCGDAWFDNLITHATVESAYARWMDGRLLRTSQIGGAGYFVGPDGQEGFTYAGVTFFNSRAALGGTSWITGAECRFFPVGVPQLFQEIDAPADYIETVNTEGMDFYVKQERMKFDKGIDIEVQSNPLIIPTRPRALIRGTQS